MSTKKVTWTWTNAAKSVNVQIKDYYLYEGFCDLWNCLVLLSILKSYYELIIISGYIGNNKKGSLHKFVVVNNHGKLCSSPIYSFLFNGCLCPNWKKGPLNWPKIFFPIFEQCLVSGLDSSLVLHIRSLYYLLLDEANLPSALA